MWCFPTTQFFSSQKSHVVGRGLDPFPNPPGTDQPMLATVGELPRAIFLKRRCLWLGGGGLPEGLIRVRPWRDSPLLPPWFFLQLAFFLGFVFFVFNSEERKKYFRIYKNGFKIVVLHCFSSMIPKRSLKRHHQKNCLLDMEAVKKSFLVFTGCALSWWNTLKMTYGPICSGWILV